MRSKHLCAPLTLRCIQDYSIARPTTHALSKQVLIELPLLPPPLLLYCLHYSQHTNTAGSQGLLGR
jgi:hypothetical protein